MEHAIAERARIGEDRFLDVHHHELVADPLGTVRRVYDLLGLDLRPASSGRSSTWQAPTERAPRAPTATRPSSSGSTTTRSAPTTTSTSATSTWTSRDDHHDGLPTWDDQMEALKGVADHLLATWRPDGATRPRCRT